MGISNVQPSLGSTNLHTDLGSTRSLSPVAPHVKSKAFEHEACISKKNRNTFILELIINYHTIFGIPANGF